MKARKPKLGIILIIIGTILTIGGIVDPEGHVVIPFGLIFLVWGILLFRKKKTEVEKKTEPILSKKQKEQPENIKQPHEKIYRDSIITPSSVDIMIQDIKSSQNIGISETSTLDGKINDLWNRIPNDIKDVLFYTAKTPRLENHSGLNTITMGFTGGDFKVNYNDHVHNDPSTIYFKLPLAIPQDISLVPKLPYMPSYFGINPEQRFIYLNWLQDISRDIEVGYKFIFYYGLERMLIIGNYKKAFDMIVKLRKNTENGSFQAYSGNALFYTTIKTGKEDALDKLSFFFDDKIWYDKQIMLKLFKQEPIEPHELLRILKRLNINKRYLDEKIYLEQLGKLLSEKYGHSYLIPQDSIDENVSIEEDIPVFANFSLPDKIRITKIALPDLNNFISIIIEIHTICHERTKEKLAQLRKKK